MKEIIYNAKTGEITERELTPEGIAQICDIEIEEAHDNYND